MKAYVYNDRDADYDAMRCGADYAATRRDGCDVLIALLCYAGTVLTVVLERAALNARIADSTLATNTSLARRGSVGLLARILTCRRTLSS